MDCGPLQIKRLSVSRLRNAAEQPESNRCKTAQFLRSDRISTVSPKASSRGNSTKYETNMCKGYAGGSRVIEDSLNSLNADKHTSLEEF